jgi:hypothetical protein
VRETGQPMNFGKFPPYGIIPNAYSFDDKPPADWKNPSGYLGWFEDNISAIKEMLWPEFVPGACSGWTGSSKNRIEALTLADLSILLKIRKVGPDRPYDHRPDSSLRTLHADPHSTLFNLEDDGRIGESFEDYDHRQDAAAIAVERIFSQGLYRRKTGSIIVRAKSRLQRPRPHQMAYILLPEDQSKLFTWQLGKSGITPSVPSGHCFQGIMGACVAIERILADRTPMNRDSWAAIEQFGVDVGDRRVMAGVHYPSDNIASWILALSAAEQVFENSSAVKRHMWSAISRRSIVYRLIEDAMTPGTPASEAYGPSWRELHRRAR